MRKLLFVPDTSVGPFVFGARQSDVRKLMKIAFDSECQQPMRRKPPAYELEYYANPDVILGYKDSKLISVDFIDDRRERFCEIYLEKEKIWPRTENKFLSIFGDEAFINMYDTYYHAAYSLAVTWKYKPSSLLVGQADFSETIELFANSLHLWSSAKSCSMGHQA